MTQLLLALIYAMAAATAALVLMLLGIAEPPLAVLSGGVIFLAMSHFQALLSRRRERRQVRVEIAGLKGTAKALAGALEETQAAIAEVSASAEAKAQAESKKIVAELQVLETMMRDFAGRISQKARAVPAASAEIAERRVHMKGREAPAGFGHPDLLETIRSSLEQNRVDVYLQPIVTLPQRKLRFYEALTRLRSEDGQVIMPSQYIRIAGPAGLMSVVDNLLLFRCVQLMRRLTQKNRDLGLFCNISGETLLDAEFFPQFLEYMHHNRDLAHQLVFEFTQDAVLNAGEKGEENLSYLSTMGFGLSMDHVQTLGCDYSKLRHLGFRHIKISGQMLTAGMRDAGSSIAAEDLKVLLARHGLNLIAERVEDEKTVVQLLDYGVDLAQGYLFGEPRGVRDDQKMLPDRLAPVIPFRRAG